MKDDVKKLQRLLRAQSVMEGQAQLLVTQISIDVVSLERKLEAAKTAVNSAQLSMLFSDLYVGHQIRLIDARKQKQGELQDALVRLQREKIKSKKVGEKLDKAISRQKRELEERALLEIFDRTSHHIV